MDVQLLERDYPCVTIEDRKKIAVDFFNQLREVSRALPGFSIYKTTLQQSGEDRGDSNERILLEPVSVHSPDAGKAFYQATFVAFDKVDRDWTFKICTVLLTSDPVTGIVSAVD